jgi:four helix bundle protein
MFSHEKLIVYQRSIEFVAWTQPLIESLSSKLSAKGQLDRASTSIPLNIAEGNVKFSTPDRVRFLQFAQGSTVECAACLDVLVARAIKTSTEVAVGKGMLEEVARMLSALLSRLGYRFEEASAHVKDDDHCEELNHEEMKMRMKKKMKRNGSEPVNYRPMKKPVKQGK